MSVSPRKAGFLPVILGTMIHGYTPARSFHETYGVKSVMLGKYKTGFTWGSSILDIELHDDISEDEGFLRVLTQKARQLKATYGVPLVLVPSNDMYVELVARHADTIRQHYVFNSPDETLRSQIMDKQAFYQLAAQHGIDIPATQVHQMGEPFTLEVDRFPVIIKPANPNQWWLNHQKIAGHQKIYRLNSIEEVHQVVRAVEASDYRDSLIIQEFVPGDDSRIWDAVLYLNSEAKCELVTLGQVALQEHESHLVGSYTAIISKYDEELMLKFKEFLETIGYTGVANVDMKWDERDGVYKVMEINCRPGRSSYYPAQMGHPVMQYLVDDVVFGRRKGLTLAQADILFRVVPKYVLRKYVTDPETRAEVDRLLAEGKDTNPLVYAKDISPRRNASLLRRYLVQGRRYEATTWRHGL
ncbi:carboxylate--amine ligase [Nesterenkonia ebinurensis]|uniref:carboxylate--amine ligase n=1 Tax=Nesterenkonia ebinurensis TaxID=2608252 RepID=UPI00123E3329|nr:carboxylate--amine ligase [Nesterenkonia ebinurensis]